MNHRPQPLQLYVSGVVVAGGACAAFVLITGAGTLPRLLEPELALFALCAMLGELVPLKVHTRGSEGEVTTSTCFALALMLAGGPAIAMAGLLAASVLADTVNRKPARKVAFNAGQYAISVAAAALVLALTTDIPRAGALPFAPDDLLGVLGAAAVFFLVNSVLVSSVVALAQGVTRVGRYLATDLFFQASTAGLLLGLSPVVVLAAEFALPALGLLLLPFLAVHRGGRAAIAKEHQSLHDALTGLPNRTLFRDRIEQAVANGRRAGRPCAVMLIDLDRFKEINDTLGHHAGDRLLEEVARRLQRSLGEGDTVARLGGDEFGVLLPFLRHVDDAELRRQAPAGRAARAVLDRGPAGWRSTPASAWPATPSTAPASRR